MARPRDRYLSISHVLALLFVLSGCQEKPPTGLWGEDEALQSFQCDPAGWCWEHPVPNGYDLHTVWGSEDGSLVIAVGERGTIVERVDGVWRQLSADTSLDILAVHGWPTGEAIAVGEDGLVLHREAGVWRTRTSGAAERLFEVWGRSPSDVITTEGLHWDGGRWGKLLSRPSKWRLRATKAVKATYDQPPGDRDGSLEDMEIRLASGDYEMRVIAGCKGNDGVSFLGDIWFTGKGGQRAKYGSMNDWCWLVHATETEWTAFLAPDGLSEVNHRFSSVPLVCSPSGSAILVTGNRRHADDELAFYRRRGDELVRDDRMDDLSASQIVGAVEPYKLCSSPLREKFVKTQPRARKALETLCKAPGRSRDRAWIHDDGTDGVIVGDAGRVLEYRDGDWAAVFPKPTQYSELIRDPGAYEMYGSAHLEADQGERGEAFGVEHARWEYRPSLWVSDDGKAYVAHGRSVLKRSAPGQWEGIFEDDLAGGVLTALWGASGDEIFVGSSTGFISRYDGESWTREFSDEQLSITAIWTSRDDAWAAGADRSSSMRFRAGACRRGGCRSDEEGQMVSVHRGLLLQRVEGAWTKVRLPDQLPTLSSAWASSPNDVYVGTIGRGLWHFDGSKWKRRAVRRSESDAKPLPSSRTDAKARDLDFIHAIWGASGGQLLVVASPMPHVSWVGITLLELDGDTSKTVKLDSYVEPGGLHGDPDHVLAAIGYDGVAQLRNDQWTRFRRIGEAVRVWAGAEYDYALSREGYFWFRRRPE